MSTNETLKSEFQIKFPVNFIERENKLTTQIVCFDPELTRDHPKLSANVQQIGENSYSFIIQPEEGKPLPSCVNFGPAKPFSGEVSELVVTRQDPPKRLFGRSKAKFILDAFDSHQRPIDIGRSSGTLAMVLYSNARVAQRK